MAPIAIETYPVIVRNTALGIFGCSATLFLIFGSICASILLETTEENFVFVCVFAGSLLISAISAIFVVETKGFDADSHYYSKKSNSF